MTIIESINQIDALKPNSYSPEQKIQWLSNLDGIIKKEIIDMHEDAVEFEKYTESTDMNTKLLAPYPYDTVYIHYLEMMISYYNGEYGKYNNSLLMYESAYTAFKNYYARENNPKNKGKRFLF